MTMTDPISDMLTRIRNGQQARLVTVLSPFSKVREGLLEVLKREGYISDFSLLDGEDGHPAIKIELKYHNGEAAIKEINRVSKPGRRVYSKIKKLKKFYNGLGVVILSTPKGILSDYEARKEGVGGEVLCAVF